MSAVVLDPSDNLRRLTAPREMLPNERAVIERLLDEPFVGRDELRIQLRTARVVSEGDGDTRTIKFDIADDLPAAFTALRVPVEGEAPDRDGIPITFLLHVVDGRAAELEIYRVDGEVILDAPAADRLTVVVTEASEHGPSRSEQLPPGDHST